MKEIDGEMEKIKKMLDIKQLEGKNFLITGATGLIGYNYISFLLCLGKQLSEPPHIIAVVRDLEKAEYLYRDHESSNIRFLVADVRNNIEVEERIDYLIHAASITSSKMFVEHPVETIQTAYQGTINMLELARVKQVKSFVYLSTMEIYGAPCTDDKIFEDAPANLDTMKVRSSYPEVKRLCETLCASYFSEYGVPVKVLRLTQTLGAGISYDDNRVFAEFARCVIEKRDIILHTKGETKRSYLAGIDAVTAVMVVLLNGENGEAYNAAREDSYCSIYEMAKLVARECANDEIVVVIKEEAEMKYGYAPVLKMNLDTSKLRGLGWRPVKDLSQMFLELCGYMEKVKGESDNTRFGRW